MIDDAFHDIMRWACAAQGFVCHATIAEAFASVRSLGSAYRMAAGTSSSWTHARQTVGFYRSAAMIYVRATMEHRLRSPLCLADRSGSSIPRKLSALIYALPQWSDRRDRSDRHRYDSMP